MKTIITTLVLCLTLGICKAQKLKETDVPAPVKEALKKQYPNAKVEKWEKEGANYEAEIEQGKSEMSVVFDATGKLVETEVEIKVSELPKAISDYVSKNMAGKKIKEASKITMADGSVMYEAEIDNTDYIFDSNGTLIKKETDTEKDDKD